MTALLAISVEELQRCPDCGRWSVKLFRKTGIYRCIDEDCGEVVAVEQLAPTPPSFPDTALDLTDVPFPLAYPLTHARDERRTGMV